MSDDPKNQSEIPGSIGIPAPLAVVSFSVRGNGPSIIEAGTIMALDKALALSQKTKQAAPKDAVTPPGSETVGTVSKAIIRGR